MRYIDLHVHSNASDGSLRPSELVYLAMSKGLSAFALTDHDTVDGIEEALTAAQYTQHNPADKHKVTMSSPAITVIPGIELSAEYNGQDIHILGLNIDYKNSSFLNKIEEFRAIRESRNEQMILRMQEQGIDITSKLVEQRFGTDTVITRAHYAILMAEGGYVTDKNEAFDKYLNPGCPCYIPRYKISVTDAVKLILSADGKPVLAHPVLYQLTEKELEELVSLLKDNGLLGIEAIYSCNKGDDEMKLRKLAEKYGLFITGGSDFHGTAKPGLELGTGYGDLKVPEELLKNIID